MGRLTIFIQSLETAAEADFAAQLRKRS